LEKNSLHMLEERIDQAVRRILELEKSNKSLIEQRNALQAQLQEKELVIEDLENRVVELRERPDDEIIQRYKEKEVELRHRIQTMITKLDELDRLE